MPNSLTTATDIYSTVPAALGKASQIAKFSNAILDSVYWDVRPEAGVVGKNTNIVFPNVNAGNVTNVGAGGVTAQNPSHNSVPLVISQKMANTYKIPSEIATLADVPLMSLYFQGWLEELVRGVNVDVKNQLINNDAATAVGSPVVNSTKMPALVANSGNFVPGSLFAGSGTGYPSRQDISKASGILFQNGIPLEDGDLYALTSGVPYFAMTSDPNYSQSYFVGESAAVAAQQQGKLRMLNGATVFADQTFPVSSDATPKYFTLMAHKIAHGGRFIAEEIVSNKTTFETFVYPKPGMPVRVSIWYSPDAQANVISFSCIYGVTVIRPDWRVMIQN